MLNILLTGHSGSSNRGCEAIVRTTVDIINRHLAANKITLMSFDPESDRRLRLQDTPNLEIPDVITTLPDKYSLNWLLKGIDRRLLSRVYPGFPSYFSLVNRSFYRSANVVISVGGDNFSDDYDVPTHYFGELNLARLFGSLTVIWGASIGPFHNPRLEAIWATQLRKVDLITVREQASLEYLRKIGVENNVRRVADPAFLLPPCSKGVDPLLTYKPRTIIGIGMSAIIGGYGFGQERYVDAFASFCQQLLSATGAHLVLIPHVTKKGTFNNDETPCRQLASKLPNNGRVTLATHEYTASQIKYLIAQCDYFIGARTHSTIASISSCVPTISIAYSPKANGINNAIFGHTDYVIPLNQLDPTSLMRKFTLIWNNRSKIVDYLRARLPAIERLANQGGTYLDQMLQRNKHVHNR